MSDKLYYEWICLEDGILIYWESCREVMMEHAFNEESNKNIYTRSNDIQKYMKEAEEYIKKWNRHFKQNVKIEIGLHKARIVNSNICILHLIFYSVLRGDLKYAVKNYADGGLLDYCIKNSIRTEELESYEAHIIENIFPMDWDDDSYKEINGPIDYTEYFMEWREK